MNSDSETPNNNPGSEGKNEGGDGLAPRDCATVDCLLPKPAEGLQRKVGLLSGISLIVGTVIGSGIFASPRYVMENCGSVGLTLVVWALCGVLGTFGALCYAELGTAIPLSGAEYSYLYEAFGPLLAFLYSWTAVVVLKPSQVAIICLAFGAYVIEPIFPGCSDREDLAGLVKILAAIAIGRCSIFSNCYLFIYFLVLPVEVETCDTHCTEMYERSCTFQVFDRNLNIFIIICTNAVNCLFPG